MEIEKKIQHFEKYLKMFIEQSKRGQEIRKEGCAIQPPRGTQVQSVLTPGRN